MKKYKQTLLQKIKENQFFKKSGLFNIRSFIFLFTLYSLISVWLSSISSDKDKKINYLKEKSKKVKTEYVSKRATLINLTNRTNLLEKAAEFDFYAPSEPITVIKLNDES